MAATRKEKQMIRMKRGWSIVVLGAAVLIGCAQSPTAEEEFVTSGSPEADQRAQQRMAREQQLQEGGSETASGSNVGPGAAERVTLYDRLGGDEGLAVIVNDFIDRAMADPRVNWTRKGVPAGGLVVGVGSVEWDATPERVEQLKRHMTQFLAVATGGPTVYHGQNLREAHDNMRITNAEFDATVGDLKATLDKLGIPDQEQKELLAIIETTRPQIVEER